MPAHNPELIDLCASFTDLFDQLGLPRSSVGPSSPLGSCVRCSCFPRVIMRFTRARTFFFLASFATSFLRLSCISRSLVIDFGCLTSK